MRLSPPRVQQVYRHDLSRNRNVHREWRKHKSWNYDQYHSSERWTEIAGCSRVCGGSTGDSNVRSECQLRNRFDRRVRPQKLENASNAGNYRDPKWLPSTLHRLGQAHLRPVSPQKLTTSKREAHLDFAPLLKHRQSNRDLQNFPLFYTPLHLFLCNVPLIHFFTETPYTSL